MDQHTQQTRRAKQEQTHQHSTPHDPLQSFIAQKQPAAAAAKLLQRATSTRQQHSNAAAAPAPSAAPAAASAAPPAATSASPQMPPHTDSPSLRALKAAHLHPACVVSAACGSSSSGGSEVWEEPTPKHTAARAAKRRRAHDDADYTEQASAHDAESEVRSEADDDDDEDDDGGAPVKGASKKAGGASANLTSAEAKRRRRQQQNRDAAATSRNRKKAYLAGLESKVQSLESENSKLRAQLKAQKAMIESMRSQVQTRIHSAPAPMQSQHQPQPVAPKLVQVAAYQRDHARRVAAAVSAPAAAAAHPQAPLSPSDSFSSAPTSPRDQSGFERTSSASTQRASPVSTQFQQQQRPAALHLQPTAACSDDELPALSSPAPLILHKQTSLEAVPHASTYLFPSESTTSSSTLLTQEMQMHDSTQQHPLSMHPSQFYMDDASAPYGRVFEHDSHSSLYCASTSASFLSSSSPCPAVASLSPESHLITRVPAVERITESLYSADHQQCVSIICLSTLIMWLQLTQGWTAAANSSSSESNKNSMQTTTTTTSSSNTAPAPSFSSKAGRPASDTFLERAARRTDTTLQSLSVHSDTTQAHRTFMHITPPSHRAAIACC